MLPKTIFENWVHPGHGIYFAVSIYIIISVFPWSVASPPPRRSKLLIACSDFFQKSERTHSAAPPFRIEPAALGFDSVLETPIL